MPDEEEQPKWPRPFGGISYKVAYTVKDQMLEAMIYLAEGCGRGHAHNFAVETDAAHTALWVSRTGTACLEDRDRAMGRL